MTSIYLHTVISNIHQRKYTRAFWHTVIQCLCILRVQTPESTWVIHIHKLFCCYHYYQSGKYMVDKVNWWSYGLMSHPTQSRSFCRHLSSHNLSAWKTKSNKTQANTHPKQNILWHKTNTNWSQVRSPFMTPAWKRNGPIFNEEDK